MQAEAQSTAFYYGPNVPPELRAAYDQIVVEPDNLSDPRQLFDGKPGAAPVAYMSIGEQAKALANAIDPAWVLGRNQAWASTVMNVAHPGYQQFVAARFEKLWAAGYRRFFLDTLDSYTLGADDAATREKLRRALCELIKSMAKRHPEARWLLNRGFELLPDIAKVVHGVVAESLFDRFDAAHGTYVRVPENDRTWLLGKLREAHTRYRLPITVIDYRPSSEREEARATARKIAALGFTPWVCEGNLMSIGVGSVEIMPRRVLILGEHAAVGGTTGVARWLAPVLEYLGYVPEFRGLDEGLPDYELVGRYRGIVSVFGAGFVDPSYTPWLARQVRAGVRVAVFGGLGFAADSALARELGIAPLTTAAPGTAQLHPIAVAARDGLIGFEAEPPLRGIEGVPVQLTAAGAHKHLVIRGADGRDATAIASTRWGGLALSHAFALRGLHGEYAWVVDPFAFLTSALALPEMPVPDVTTESGRRVALFVIEPDGLADNARQRGRPPLWSVVRRDIIDASPWPHAVAPGDSTDRGAKRDQAAAQKLLAGPATYRDAIEPGMTAARGTQRSLTQLQPLFDLGADAEITAPIAADASYLDGSNEAYAFSRVIETFEYTDAPRRLRPLALHYHASAVSSPGGLSALSGVYKWLEHQLLLGIRVDDYKARIHAFREQVIVQRLDGSFSVIGGAALRTLRVPTQLGLPDLSRSRGVASVATLAQGRYVTFTSHGPRSLQLQAKQLDGTHLAQTNGRVERFDVIEQSAQRVRVQLHVVAERSAEIRLAGLTVGARCSLHVQGRDVSSIVEADGGARFTALPADTGVALFSCSPGVAR